MTIGGTPVPKRELIPLILQNISVNQICSILKIQTETDLQRRLADFTKNQLINILHSTPEGLAALEKAKANYPLTSNPTLYLISVNFFPDRQKLLQQTEVLANQMRGEAFLYGNDRTVRSVYIITTAREYFSQISFLEIPVVYEKKIEYVISDTDSENYGEVDKIFSLEKAIIWYSERFKHALLLCGDFSAVKPILSYGRSKLGIRWQIPYLSEQMLHRLTEGANPRTASFSRLENNPSDELDIHTMTISDQVLGESKSYRRLVQDQTRHQTSGFYSSHPDLVYGGLGISRQYGRIWTPARLRKDSLLALSVNLIQKTEEELNREADINPIGYIAYFKNRPITLAGKKVTASQRFAIEEIIKAIINARKSSNSESLLKLELIWELICQFVELDLNPALEIHCDNCGDYLLRCPICQSPYQPIKNDQQIVFQCPNHPEQIIYDDQNITCECGANLEITFSSDIRIFPGAELLKSLHEFLAIPENQQYDGSFQIIGNLLRLLPRTGTIVTQYSLDNFRAWISRAHIHQRNISDESRINYLNVLNRIKEKCSRNNGHPTKQICEACMNEEISKKRIYSGDEICLPRIFGYVIDNNFDGIHHNHEIADLRYSDLLDETGVEKTLGIHLKSRQKHRIRGLGRSVTCMKGLYTQYCYSAYLTAKNKANLNVIGISIPNKIADDVAKNFIYLANQLGYPLLIIAEDEWVKIIDAALEKADFRKYF